VPARFIIAALVLCSATAVTAQPNASPPVASAGSTGPVLRSSAACAESGGATGYTACALRSDDLIVRRGATGQIVARPGFLSGPDIVSLVTGDSAIAYARVAQRQLGRSRVLTAASIAVLVGSLFIIPKQCRTNNSRDCGGSDLAPVLGVQAVGIGLAIPGTYLRRRSVQSLSSAVWWHNAQYAR
jgi:hypothetical protein